MGQRSGQRSVDVGMTREPAVGRLDGVCSGGDIVTTIKARDEAVDKLLESETKAEEQAGKLLAELFQDLMQRRHLEHAFGSWANARSIREQAVAAKAAARRTAAEKRAAAVAAEVERVAAAAAEEARKVAAEEFRCLETERLAVAAAKPHICEMCTSRMAALEDAKTGQMAVKERLVVEQTAHIATEERLASEKASRANAMEQLKSEQAAHAAAREQLELEQAAHAATQDRLVMEQAAFAAAREQLHSEITAHAAAKEQITSERAAEAAKLLAATDQLAVTDKLHAIQLKEVELRHEEASHLLAIEYQNRLEKKQMEWMDELETRTLRLERSASQSQAELFAGQQQLLGSYQTEHVQELQSVQQLLAAATAQLSENAATMQREHVEHAERTALSRAELVDAQSAAASANALESELSSGLQMAATALDRARHSWGTATLRRMRSTMLEDVMTYWKKHTIDFRHRYHRWHKISEVLHSSTRQRLLWNWLTRWSRAMQTHKLCRVLHEKQVDAVESERTRIQQEHHQKTQSLTNEHAENLLAQQQHFSSELSSAKERSLEDLSAQLDSIRTAFQAERDATVETMATKLSKLHRHCDRVNDDIAVHIAAHIATAAAVDVGSNQIRALSSQLQKEQSAAARSNIIADLRLTNMRKAVIQKIKRRQCSQSEHSIFAAWREICARNRRVSSVMAKVLARLRHDELARAFQALADDAFDRRRNRAMMVRALHMINHHLLASVFGTWATVHRRRQKAKTFLTSKRGDMKVKELEEKLTESEERRRKEAQQQALHQAHAQQLSAQTLDRFKADTQQNIVIRLRRKHIYHFTRSVFEQWLKLVMCNRKRDMMLMRAIQSIRNRLTASTFATWVNVYRQEIKRKLLAQTIGSSNLIEQMLQLTSQLRREMSTADAASSTPRTQGGSVYLSPRPSFAEEFDTIIRAGSTSQGDSCDPLDWQPAWAALYDTASSLLALQQSSVTTNRELNNALLKLQAETGIKLSEHEARSEMEIAKARSAQQLQQSEHQVLLKRLTDNHHFQHAALENQVKAVVTSSAADNSRIQSALEATEADLAATVAAHRASLLELQGKHDTEFAKLKSKTRGEHMALEKEVTAAATASAAARLEMESTLQAQAEAKLAATEVKHHEAMTTALAGKDEQHKTELHLLKTKSQQQQSAMEQQVASAIAASATARVEAEAMQTAQAEAQLAAAASAHRAALASLEADHDARISALEQEVTAAAAASTAARMELESTLEAKAEAKLADLGSAHRAALAELHRRHDSELSTLKANHQAEYTVQQQRVAAAEERAEMRLAEAASAHRSSLTALHSQQESEVERLKTNHRTQQSALEEQVTQRTSSSEAARMQMEAMLGARAEAKLAAVVSAHHAELSEQQMQHESKVAQLRRAHQHAREDATTELQQQHQVLVQSAAAAAAAAARKETELEYETKVDAQHAALLSSHQAALSDVRSQYDAEIENLNKRHRAQNEVLQDQVTTSATAARLEMEMTLEAKARAQLAEASSAHYTALSENQTEHEAEVTSYKRRCAALEEQLASEVAAASALFRTESQSRQDADTEARLAEATSALSRLQGEIESMRTNHEMHVAVAEQQAAAAARVEAEAMQTAQAEAQLAAAASAHRAALASLEADHDARISALEQEVTAAAAASTAARMELESTLEAKAEAKLADLGSAHRAALAELHRRHDSELSTLKANHQAEYTVQQQRVAAAEERAEMRLAEAASAHRSSLKALHSQHESEVERLKTNHRTQQSALEEQVTQRTSSSEAMLGARAEAKLAAVVSAHHAELSEQQMQHESKVAQLRRAHQHAREDATTELQQQHQVLVQSAAAAAAAAARKETELEYETKVDAQHAALLSSHQAALSDVRSQYDAEIENLNKRHRAQNEVLQDQVTTSATAARLEMEMTLEAKARAQLAEASSAHYTALSENQTEHEAEVTSYKRRCAALEEQLASEVAAASALFRTESQSRQDADTEARLAEATSALSRLQGEIESMRTNHEMHVAVAEQQAAAAARVEAEAMQTAQAEAQLAAAASAHRVALASLEADHDARISALEQEVTAAAAASTAARMELESTLEAKAEAKLADLGSAHRAALAELHRRHDSELSTLKANHQAEYTVQQQRVAAAEERAEMRLAEAASAHRSSLKALHSQHESEVERLKTNHRTQQSALEEQVTQRTSSSEAMLGARAEAKLAAVVSAHHAELSEQQMQHESKVAQLRRAHQHAREDATTELQQQHQVLVQSAAAAAAAAARKETELEYETKVDAQHAALLSSHQAALSDVRSQYDAEIENLNKRHRAQNEVLQDQVTTSATAARLEMEMTLEAKARAQLAEASSAHYTALSENQTEHEAEVTSYKRRCAALEEQLASEVAAASALFRTESQSRQDADTEARLAEATSALSRLQGEIESMRTKHETEIATVKQIAEQEAKLDASVALAQMEVEAKVDAKLVEASAAHRRMQVEMENRHEEELATHQAMLSKAQSDLDSITERNKAKIVGLEQQVAANASTASVRVESVEYESRLAGATAAHQLALLELADASKQELHGVLAELAEVRSQFVHAQSESKGRSKNVKDGEQQTDSDAAVTAEVTELAAEHKRTAELLTAAGEQRQKLHTRLTAELVELDAKHVRELAATRTECSLALENLELESARRIAQAEAAAASSGGTPDVAAIGDRTEVSKVPAAPTGSVATPKSSAKQSLLAKVAAQQALAASSSHVGRSAQVAIAETDGSGVAHQKLSARDTMLAKKAGDESSDLGDRATTPSEQPQQIRGPLQQSGTRAPTPSPVLSRINKSVSASRNNPS